MVSPTTPGICRDCSSNYAAFQEKAAVSGWACVDRWHRKAALVAALRHDWPGGYALTEGGELAFVPGHEAEVLAAAAGTSTRLRPVLVPRRRTKPSTNVQIANLLEPSGHDIVAAPHHLAR